MNYEHTETNLHLENEYPKLIRDKIPEIIEADGQVANTRILSDDQEYLHYLLKKVTEEAQEVACAETDSDLIEEIADLREVIDAILKLRNITTDQARQIQAAKRDKRGGFDQRLLMIDNCDR